MSATAARESQLAKSGASSLALWVLALAVASLVFAAPAQARIHHHHHRRRHRSVHVAVQPTAAATVTPMVPAIVAAAPLPSIIGVGNTPGCLSGANPTPYLQEYGATVLRVIVNPDRGADGEALPCLQAAVADGVRVDLSIQWWNPWTPDQVAAFFQRELGFYAPYVWAVSVGNEQELGIGGPGLSGAQYAADWQAVVPVVEAMAPAAVRVAGEISPWGLGYLRDAFSAGLPGAQAVGAHPYNMQGCFAIPDIEGWGLPVWFTEGLAGPHAWGPDRGLQELAGGVLAAAWLDDTTYPEAA